MSRFQTLLAAIGAAFTLASAAPAGAAIWYVDSTSGIGDGLEWESAFGSLQDALAAAQPGDEIWVKAGIHTPSDSDATASFALRNGVAMYGGFAGDEAQRSQRDPDANPTILSGDIGRDDTTNPLNFNTPNSGHVLLAESVDASAIVDGFIIERGAYGPAGTPAGHPLLHGSGLYAVDASPTIIRCVFRQNYAAFGHGGAVYLGDSSPAFIGCSFIANHVHVGNGGAIFMHGMSQPDIRDCAFIDNSITFASPDASGAGIYHYSDLPITVERCVFDGNALIPFYATGSDAGYGGGISSFRAPITVVGCVFRNNVATIGAGIIAWDTATIVNCLFHDNTAQTRSADPYPEIGGFGAGVAAYSAQADHVLIANCTFFANHGKENAAVAGGWNSIADVRNSILWANTGWKPEIQGFWREQIGGNFTLAFCDIQGIFGPPEDGEDPLEPDKLVGCSELDPLFADAPTDLRLSPASHCIDAGTNDAVPAFVATDLDANARFADDPGAPDTGAGTPPIVDMGAYEAASAPPPSCTGDIDGDHDTDVLDFAVFLAHFGRGVPEWTGGDLDGNGTVDVLDFALFVSDFGCVH